MDHLIEEIENRDQASDERRAQAARQIQRLWRKRNAAKAKYINADQRWQDAATHAKLKIGRTAAEQGKNGIRERWKRSVFLASRLQDSNKMLNKPDSQDLCVSQKYLETQHWLELVDGKHRYGSNLKWYHRRWQQEDTAENFFKWLDLGEGKNLTLNECSREQLEKERITYLSAEQQLNYLVKIDDEGKFRWARNDELVDTSAGQWKDAGGGQGIIPDDVPKQTEDVPHPRDSFDSVPSGSADSSLSPDQENAATHYVGDTKSKTRLTRLIKRHFTTRGMMDRLLRKTVKKNTWIYVSDKNSNIFIGIKVTGTFQHSSLSAGGVVTSAGLISVKEGVIHSLTPLSGHYRTSIDNFHQFVDCLHKRNVDMSKVHISKAEIALWGIGHIKKAQKAKSKAVNTGKKKVKNTAYKMVDVVWPNSGNDENPGSWKKDILEGRQKRLRNSREEDADSKTKTQTTDARQTQQAGSLNGQAANDDQKVVAERGEGETPEADSGRSDTLNPEASMPKETRPGTPGLVAKKNVNDPAGKSAANTAATEE